MDYIVIKLFNSKSIFLKMKKKYLLLSIISIILFLYFRILYRPFIYKNNFFDFYVADTAPNFFPVLVFVFFKKYQDTSINTYIVSSAAFIGLTIYEFFIQHHIYTSTFDWKDIFASLLASILAIIICFIIEIKNINIESEHRPHQHS